MKAFFAVSSAGWTAEFESMALALAKSAADNSDLVLHCIYDGAPNKFTNALENLGARMIFHKPAYTKQLELAASLDKRGVWKDPSLCHGTFLRLDTPILVKKLGYDDKYVLYLDADIIILKNPDLSGIAPRYLAASCEFDANDWSYFNAGVLLLNVDNMYESYHDFLNFCITNRFSVKTSVVDQGLYNEFYREKWVKLPIECNWKAYWKPNPGASILHFHGPKPNQIGRYLGGDRHFPDVFNNILRPENNNNLSYHVSVWKQYANDSQTAPDVARQVKSMPVAHFKFSVCTLVTRLDEYQKMLKSFQVAGFTTDVCEFIYVNNMVVNEFDAFTGLNVLIAAAQGEHIILCHEDILLNFDSREALEKRIAEMNQLDSSWAVLGNTGMDAARQFHTHISQSGEEVRSGTLPARCESLDENFLVLKRASGVRLSFDLKGFHFYGTDICHVAKTLGYTTWAIDFHLTHESRGKVNTDFIAGARNIESKFRKLRQTDSITAVCANLYFGRCRFWRRYNDYRRLYYMKKNGGTSNINDLFGKSAPFYWLFHRLIRPFENLRRNIKKRLTL